MSAPVPPAAPPDEIVAPIVGRSPLRLTLQVVGFMLSLGLLGWAVWSVLRQPGMMEKLPRLLETPAWLVAALLALSGATIALSGLVFWTVLLPVRRLRALDLVAVNGVCTLLGAVPFKASLIFRVLTHLRRDALPLMQIGGWFAATGVVILLSVVGALAATLARSDLDAAWWAIALGGTGAAGLALVLLGRALGRGGLMTWAGRRAWTDNLARGLVMLSDPGTVSLALVWRSLDIACQAARFYLAGQAALGAGLVTRGLDPEQAILAGAIYFLVQMLSPFGTLGPREWVTKNALAFAASAEFGIVVLVVSAAETVMAVVMGALGLWYLRPDRYLFGSASRTTRHG